MFNHKENRRLVTVIGLLVLYGIVTSAYIVSLSPKFSNLGNRQQETLARAIELEYRLREVAGLTDEEDLFSVDLKQDSRESSKIYAYVKRTSATFPFAAVSDVYFEHYHPAELKGESLFIIRRIGETDGDFQDELWRYGITGESERLYASQGVDFRASPTGNLIAIAEPSKLVIIRPDTGEKKDIRWPDLAGEFENSIRELSQMNGAPIVFLEGWSQDGGTFWGTLGWAGNPNLFFRINPVTGAVKAYDATALESFGEYVLHPTTGRIAYSTYPRMFDVDSADSFRRSNQRVELRVLDLLRNKDTLIAESAGRAFNPKWIDGSTVEYDSPENAFIRMVNVIE